MGATTLTIQNFVETTPYQSGGWTDGKFEILVTDIETDEISVEKFKYCALVFDEPSKYGINDGRISKLEIRHMPTNEVIVNYDRNDWDVDRPFEDFLYLTAYRHVLSKYDTVDRYDEIQKAFQDTLILAKGYKMQGHQVDSDDYEIIKQLYARFENIGSNAELKGFDGAIRIILQKDITCFLKDFRDNLEEKFDTK
jgi:hypothetical protein